MNFSGLSKVTAETMSVGTWIVPWFPANSQFFSRDIHAGCQMLHGGNVLCQDLTALFAKIAWACMGVLCVVLISAL